jgi:hypothetical protein
MKGEMMSVKGLTLIHVPYWWKNEERYFLILQMMMHVDILLDSLIATIQGHDKDLLCDFFTETPCVSLSPPSNLDDGVFLNQR